MFTILIFWSRLIKVGGFLNFYFKISFSTFIFCPSCPSPHSPGECPFLITSVLLRPGHQHCQSPAPAEGPGLQFFPAAEPYWRVESSPWEARKGAAESARFGRPTRSKTAVRTTHHPCPQLRDKAQGKHEGLMTDNCY